MGLWMSRKRGDEGTDREDEEDDKGHDAAAQEAAFETFQSLGLSSSLGTRGLTRGRYERIHPQIHDKLAVVIRRVPDRERREPQAR